MYKDFQAYLQNELNSIKEAGLYKEERVIVSPQGPEITLQDGTKALNFCANNYLGLADSKELVKAAKDAMDTHGYGMASVRFICGTGDLQKTLEAKMVTCRRPSRPRSQSSSALRTPSSTPHASMPTAVCSSLF